MVIESLPISKTIIIASGYARTKRIFDIIFTLCILPFLGIIILILALFICFDSKGGIIFRQKRVGMHGAEFEMFKLRSMYENSDDRHHREAIKQYMNGQPLNGNAHTPYKLENDNRVTKIGQFLRQTSLDELPQFWNVLRGEMSLVGPRPPLPYEVEMYSSRDMLRLSGKPGLTGPWQVYGRSRTPFHEMVEMDIAYLERQSFWEDLKLIALTIPVMLQKRGGA
jgi:lipopolysaccharide/colanic/teichoic acid biosynthesis glycosyltransferase